MGTMLRRIIRVAGFVTASSEDAAAEETWKNCGRRTASMNADSLISCDNDTTAPWK